MVQLKKARSHSSAVRHESRMHETLALGELQGSFDERLRIWGNNDFLDRLWAKDPTLWIREPAAEIADRLGWLDLPAVMSARIEELEQFADNVRAGGFTNAIVLGMGGSSLAPDVFQKTFGNTPGHPVLAVLDSTHPAAVAEVEAGLDLSRTLFVVSSKSGTTLEPLSFFRYFWARLSRITDSPGRQFIAVTDPGSPLLDLARHRKFQQTFLARPDVGGRYSAFTEFGLVPAAIIGLDIRRLLDQAKVSAESNAAKGTAGEAPGLRLAAALGEAALAGRDKLTFLTAPSLRAFPDWLEQLVAESTGKDGKGIVPIAGESFVEAKGYGRDRIFVSLALDDDPVPEIDALEAALEKAGHPVIRIRLADVYALGQAMFEWEVAIAAAGSILGINPFNQPDVELAKELARQAMSAGSGRGASPHAVEDTMEIGSAAAGKAFDGWLAQARSGDYIAIQAYLSPDARTVNALQGLRSDLLKRTGLATTLGFGPRFLHSTGQLHKGGPNSVLALQLVDRPPHDLDVPETDYGFRRLIGAQALGDYRALRQKGRRVLRIDLKSAAAEGIGRLRDRAGR